jgi:hypothetical protein
MTNQVLIHLSGRSREGTYRSGYLNDSIPPCLGYFRIIQDSGRVYALPEAVDMLKRITASHPDAVVIFKPI